MINLKAFINKYVIKREESMFFSDLSTSSNKIESEIKGKKLLVIGGAGSIGSAFIKAILPFRPSSLVVVDINENSLAELTRDLRSTIDMYIPETYITYPMDFASSVFEKMFRHYGRFDIVANFSAHKHVRSEKDIYSVEALLRNNLLNAKKLLDLLAEIPPEKFFCVSTDKAANPVNIMGASKRIMEDLIFSYSDKFLVNTARFANVAFSNGSLPAGFLARINKLQPLSAPLDVKRFFVSPEESGHICLLACIMGRNREIFFPKLDDVQMMSFDSIAKNLLYEYGYDILPCQSDSEAVDKSEDLKYGSKSYPVHFSNSDTSGEKMYEEFFTSGETVDFTRFSSLGVIKAKEMPNKYKIDNLLISLSKEFEQDSTNKGKIIEILTKYLPNFHHMETGKSLDGKM